VGSDIAAALTVEQSYFKDRCERCKVLTTMLVEIQVFWDVTYCRILNIYRRVGRSSASSLRIELLLNRIDPEGGDCILCRNFGNILPDHTALRAQKAYTFIRILHIFFVYWSKSHTDIKL
jgi:hypothetical protein